MNSYVPLISRIMAATIFLLAAIGESTNLLAVKLYMAIIGLWKPEILLVIAIIIKLTAGLCVVVGYKTRWAAAALVVFLIPTTYFFHFDFSNTGEALHLMKNISIMGGMLMVFVHGAGTISIDAYLEKRKKRKANENNSIPEEIR